MGKTGYLPIIFELWFTIYEIGGRELKGGGD